MFKVFQISTLFAFVLAFVSIVQATCPDLGVAGRECPSLPAYDVACTGANEADCVNDVMQDPEVGSWGTTFIPGKFVSEGAGSSQLCYTQYQCKWEKFTSVCVKDESTANPYNKAINVEYNCDDISAGAGV